MRKLAMFAAASIAAISISTAANAQVFDSAGDTTGLMNFNDFFGGGMAGQLTLTLDSLNAGTGLFSFSYTLTNTSNVVLNPTGRISSFGFNDNQASDPTGTVLTGAFDTIDTDGANYPNGIGTLNICAFDGPAGQCTGNGNGITPGQSINGTFTLDYADGLASLTLGDYAVRYQSTGLTGEGSSTGVVVNNPPPPPPPPVPEPATWAMMLIGFGATGFALRRSRRRKTLIEQIA